MNERSDWNHADEILGADWQVPAFARYQKARVSQAP